MSDQQPQAAPQGVATAVEDIDTGQVIYLQTDAGTGKLYASLARVFTRGAMCVARAPIRKGEAIPLRLRLGSRGWEHAPQAGAGTQSGGSSRVP